MQVVLGTAAAKVPLDDFVRHIPVDEIEIVDANGSALACSLLVPAPQPGDETCTKLETVFQSHSEVLRGRAANPSRGVSTEELLSILRVLDGQAEVPCDSPIE